MTILNFGSCCIDNVYLVPHFAQPGETLPCSEYQVHAGGKGLNQSLALKYAGVPVRHAGKVGNDGIWLKELLEKSDVDTSLLFIEEGPSGHANIQVNISGENSIVLFGGTNKTITQRDADEVLQHAKYGEFLLLQNEISSLDYVMSRAAKKGLRIAFNAAPMTESVLNLPLDSVELLIINELEGKALTGQIEPDAILNALSEKYSLPNVVLTLGAAGAIYDSNNKRVSRNSESVEAIDTTGAGDTFTGYFLAAYSQDKSIDECLATACKAAAICVTRAGAASSIPRVSEL